MILQVRRRPRLLEACIWRGDVTELDAFGLHDVANCLEHHVGRCPDAGYWRTSVVTWGLNTRYGPADFTAADVILRERDGTYRIETLAQFQDSHEVIAIATEVTR